MRYSSDEDDPRVRVEGDAELNVPAGSTSSSVLLRLALHGRFSGERAGMVGGVALNQPVCDVPAGFVRQS